MNYWSRLSDEQRAKMGEVIRFGIVGVTATILQYLVYVVATRWMHPTVANTVGYAISFIYNYIASTRFTFRVKSSAKRGAGFAFSHVVNYLLQTACLSFFLWLGVSKSLAPLPMFCVCVPVNFLLVRYFLKK